MDVYGRFAISLYKRDGVQKFEEQLFVFIHRTAGKYQPLGRSDFTKSAAHRVIGAVWPAHHHVNGSASLRRPFANGVRETPWPPPSRKLFRISPRFKNKFPWCVEFAHNNNL